MPTKTFELREGAGGHVLRGEDREGNDVTGVMEPGQRIKSSKPLDKMFPNKWKCLDDEVKKEKKASAPIDEPVRRRTNRVEPELEDDTEFEHPDTYDPDVDHETEIGEEPAKEKKVKKRTSPDQAARMRKRDRITRNRGEKITDDSKEDEVNEDEEDEIEDSDENGSDVTSNFHGAVEKDLKVFKKDGKFVAYDADSLDEPLGEPVSKTTMNKFVKSYKG